MKIRSRNEKISGRRIGSLVDKSEIVDGSVPLQSTRAQTDKDRVSMIRIGSKKNPPLGVDFNGEVDRRRLDAFNGKEEGELEVRDGRLHMRIGKNDYWFRIDESDDSEPKYPELDFSNGATFSISPSEIAEIVKAEKTDAVKLEAGIGKNGKKSVFLSYTDSNGEFHGINLAVSWEGSPCAVYLPKDKVSKWGRLGKTARARIANDYPIEISGSDEGVDYDYALAPRIETEDGEIVPATKPQSEAEAQWIASRNLRSLPSSKSIVDADRRSIVSIYGSPEGFRREVDSVKRKRRCGAYEAIYAIFSDPGRRPEWMAAEHLKTVLGGVPEGDVMDTYGRLMARDGMAVYEDGKAKR